MLGLLFQILHALVWLWVAVQVYVWKPIMTQTRAIYHRCTPTELRTKTFERELNIYRAADGHRLALVAKGEKIYDGMLFAYRYTVNDKFYTLLTEDRNLPGVPNFDLSARNERTIIIIAARMYVVNESNNVLRQFDVTALVKELAGPLNDMHTSVEHADTNLVLEYLAYKGVPADTYATIGLHLVLCVNIMLADGKFETHMFSNKDADLRCTPVNLKCMYENFYTICQ